MNTAPGPAASRENIGLAPTAAAARHWSSLNDCPAVIGHTGPDVTRVAASAGARLARLLVAETGDWAGMAGDSSLVNRAGQPRVTENVVITSTDMQLQ